MSSNLSFLHSLLSGRPIITENTQLEAADENRFLQFAVSSYLAPLFHESLKGALTESSPLLTALVNSRNQVLVRNMRLYETFNWFLSELNERNIPVIPLKGIYAAEKLYGDVSLRHLSDIDVLVKPDHTERVVQLMKQSKWQVHSAAFHSDLAQRELEKAHPYTFSKDGVMIELHIHLYDRKHGAKLSAKQLWAHSYQEQFLNGAIHQFEPEMLLQHWCLHLEKHLAVFDVKMVSFWDIKLLLESQQAFRWDKFDKLCRQYECEKSVFSVLHICRAYWGINIPDELCLNDESIENKFLWCLENSDNKEVKHEEKRMIFNLKKLSKLESNREKLLFLFRFAFPKREFMMERYGLRSDKSVLLMYVIRPFVLMVKLYKALFAKFST